MTNRPLPPVSYEMADRVTNGAEFLDTYRPGWADALDLETLDLSSCSNCVLAQTVETTYVAAVREVFEPHAASPDWAQDMAIGHGFDVMHEDENYHDLEAAWRVEINKRRNQ